MGIPHISGTSFLKDSVFRTSGVSSFTLSKQSTHHPQESRGTVQSRKIEPTKEEEQKDEEEDRSPFIESELTSKLKKIRALNQDMLQGEANQVISQNKEDMKKERVEQDISTIRKQLNFSNSIASTLKENSSIQNVRSNVPGGGAPMQAISPFNIIDNQ